MTRAEVRLFVEMINYHPQTQRRTAAKEISINLAMVPVAEVPARYVQASAASGPRPRFNLIGLLRKLCVLVLMFLLSAVCYLGISHYLMESLEVVGESMLPTLNENNRYLLNRWAYHTHSPQPGDIVVIRDPGDHGISVKRIIAVEGESVHFLNGKVYVNGKELKEPYLTRATHTFTYSQPKEQFIMCGKDQYYVLGDNRIVSIDSRSYGPVPREDILGQVLMR